MEQNLRTPGPTPLPEEVLAAQAAPMINHRGPEFAELYDAIASGIARLIGCSSEVVLLTGSGTGALEASLVNTLSPGDRVLAVSIGAFGDRYAAMAEAFGARVERLAFDWGQAADPAAVTERLSLDAPYRAVLLTHNETSTGVVNPLRELVGAVHDAPGDPLVLVDGISGLGALPFEFDAWGIDLVTSASQKAWIASPGIAIAAIGPRARAAEADARMARYYWSFEEARRWAEKGQTPWTPAVSVLFGLRAGVERLLAEGRERTWARHAAIARGVEAALGALGLRFVADEGHRSPTVTAAWLPDGVDWPVVNSRLRERGVVAAGGQGRLSGKILRLGHMGEVDYSHLADAIAVLGETLGELGVAMAAAPGEAVAAGRRAFEGLPAGTR